MTDSETPAASASAAPITAETLARARAPGLLRRLATMLYDLMLLFGVLVVAAGLYYTPFHLTGHETIAGPFRVGFQVYLLAVVALYYGYFWTGGRQTLGMRAWRTRLVRSDGAGLTAADAMRRLLLAAVTLAPLGIGLWWVLFDRNSLTWYDRLSATRPVLSARPGRGA
ncbi:RDD family protein [Thiohalocapsa marina]|uniref:RDD family protein n=1 Tax=Thiohalocapsa marina TaxID=424902 RepID=A0A5M8FSY0_9GAMM|nr:RDD family protein [Thiohalocapsa marina]KAA6186352.1 RDD family protein [Thiohalocapsa marina]